MKYLKKEQQRIPKSNRNRMQRNRVVPMIYEDMLYQILTSLLVIYVVIPKTFHYAYNIHLKVWYIHALKLSVTVNILALFFFKQCLLRSSWHIIENISTIANMIVWVYGNCHIFLKIAFYNFEKKGFLPVWAFIWLLKHLSQKLIYNNNYS